MSYNYDINEIKESLTIEQIFDLLTELHGEPIIKGNMIISKTICHHSVEDLGEASHKLYYYDNTGLFKCYTGCASTFDIFELCSKIMNIQFAETFDLNDAVLWIARRFGLSGMIKDDNEGKTLDDWKVLSNYAKIQEIELKDSRTTLKTYDDSILSRLNYKVKLTPWLNEGISQEVLTKAHIGYYPGGD